MLSLLFIRHKKATESVRKQQNKGMETLYKKCYTK